MHVDPRARLRNVLSRALTGSTYVSSRREPDRVFVLEARRSGGKPVTLRFLGTSTTEADSDPDPGVALKLAGVDSTGGPWWRVLVARTARLPAHGTRVRIEAGKAKLEIVCEDVEWWEDGPAAAR